LRLEFVHPRSGAALEFAEPPPPAFVDHLEHEGLAMPPGSLERRGPSE
jgi:hypothetical protein